MSVKEIVGDTSYCFEDTIVVWTIYQDTITFAIPGKTIRYRELRRVRDWSSSREKNRVERYIFSHEQIDPRLKIVPVENTETCEKFLIRFIISKEWYIIFITSLNKSPAYILCYGVECDLCQEKQYHVKYGR